METDLKYEKRKVCAGVKTYIRNIKLLLKTHRAFTLLQFDTAKIDGKSPLLGTLLITYKTASVERLTAVCI